MQLAQDFGWTMEQIGDLSLTDLDFIVTGWSMRPPLASMVAAFMGIKTEPAEEAEPEDFAGMRGGI